jgi:hypothetical protein
MFHAVFLSVEQPANAISAKQEGGLLLSPQRQVQAVVPSRSRPGSAMIFRDP